MKSNKVIVLSFVFLVLILAGNAFANSQWDYKMFSGDDIYWGKNFGWKDFNWQREDQDKFLWKWFSHGQWFHDKDFDGKGHGGCKPPIVPEPMAAQLFLVGAGILSFFVRIKKNKNDA